MQHNILARALILGCW